MNKAEFLTAIRVRIGTLPQSDVDRTLDYYAELIDDCVENGMTEEQAVASMGSVEAIAAQVLSDTPQPQPPAAGSRRAWRGWEIALLILGSPVWVPLLLAAVIIAASVYIVLWSVVVVLYAADLSLAAGGLVGVAGFVTRLVLGDLAQALLFLGAGFVCAGLAILLFFVCNRCAVLTARLGVWSVRRIGSRLIRKGDAQ